MKVTRFRTYRFVLPLCKPLVVRDCRMTKREGRILELATDTGHCALGEVSPLPGVSEEDTGRVDREVAELKSAVMGSDLPKDLDGFTGGVERWLNRPPLAPSVRFGFETALLGLIAADQGVALSRLISDSPRAEVTVNALLAGPSDVVLSEVSRLLDEGYGTFKLKVGGRSLEETIRLGREVRDRIGPTAVLRLDANRAWTVDETLRVSRSLFPVHIDYIEEPVQTEAMLAELLAHPDSSIPVALDESLWQADPERIPFSPKVEALVLKPTMLGLERTVRLAQRAVRLGRKAVVSSSFESGFGLRVLSHLAASLNHRDVPAGLGTGAWFQRDLLVDPPVVRNGRLPVVDLPHSLEGLKGDGLERWK